MMQRAKGPHRYSIDASANLQMLTKERRSTEIGEELAGEEEVDRISVMEMEPPPSSNNRGKLWQLWSWVERVEKLCSDEKRSEADHVLWPAKSLIDSGVLRLLHMDVNGGEDSNQLDSFSKSPSLHCNVFDSPMRRYDTWMNNDTFSLLAVITFPFSDSILILVLFSLGVF